ncbi:MAG: NADP-dependent oxidoreductase [Deltaproteobacteria bacterium]|nr:MAG: NADP-dependent oxidoreductase [Deltaproteobacteria bacterium]
MNKRILLAKRPEGLPGEDTWTYEEVEIPEVQDGEFLVQHHYISLDPAMRGWLRDQRSYIAPVAVGDVMRAASVGKIVESKHSLFPEGSYVAGWGGVQQYCVTDGAGWYTVDPALAPLETYIGTLGMPGMTAYFGLLEVGKAKVGDTVLVSGAAGAVGSVVGQIAKIHGCRTVGIAGGPEKCKYLVDELGFDGAIDYKNENIREGIKTHCPKGVDVYFDNVGGEILNTALTRINRGARVVICGAISQYNSTEPVKGPSNYMSLLVNSASMIGFVVMNYRHRYKEAALTMGQWLAEGKLKSREDVYNGIDNFHNTFLRLFSGAKLGKLVLNVLEAEDLS